MKKILFLVNHDVAIYNFRLEIVERLLHEGYEVHVSSPYGKRIDDLSELGVVCHLNEFERHGMNPMKELKIISYYKKLFKSVNPDMVLGFTIKPNIYGAIAARKYNIPFVANVTGLGTAVENEGVVQRITVLLYKYAFRGIQRVFFQNIENMQFFAERNIAVGAHDLLPGSGVNLERFPLQEYPADDVVDFAFISRIMKEKGIEYYLEAAKILGSKYKKLRFHVCGFCESEYTGKLKEYHEDGIVIYHGMIQDISAFLKDINVVVLPTYYPEGINNVLLESCATGRPIITTDRSGCREVVEDGINGYKIPVKNVEQLIDSIERFLALTFEEKRQMGLNARKKVENEFDRNIVVEKYLQEIERSGWI